MEYAFTLNVLPVVGGVVIVLVLVLCELGSTGFGGGLPSGGFWGRRSPAESSRPSM